ncbi:MAG: FKBP-type peptidyl-prolyl cis-trans isomerase [Akkermansia sp.]|nr:FKBP-type peptidyl-prolyl cis-trans isomerase [Akkermansia sp.]MBR2314242.1 FKBP-type peptidyl-prolyl cis-trans isomerase [Akkermansia sp.]
MKKTYIMILAGLAIVGATTTYCFSQGNQEIAPVAEPVAAEAAATDEAAPAAMPAAPAEVSAEDARKAFSYFIGYRFGQEVAAGATTLSIDDFDKDTFFQALSESLEGKQPSIDQAAIEAGMNAFVMTMQQREQVKAEANMAAGKAYQEEFAKGEGVTKTESGLLYRVITAGDGRKYDPATDGAGAICNVMYEGKLINGTVFDKSPAPIDMPIDRVVPGFSEALKLMPIGSTWEVCIPSELAYGPQGPGPIGNNSTLIFTITLNNITKAPEPQMGAQSLQQLPPEILQQLQQQGLEIQPDDAPAEDVAEQPAPAPEAAAAPAPEAESAPAPEAAAQPAAPAPLDASESF